MVLRSNGILVPLNILQMSLIENLGFCNPLLTEYVTSDNASDSNRMHHDLRIGREGKEEIFYRYIWRTQFVLLST